LKAGLSVLPSLSQGKKKPAATTVAVTVALTATMVAATGGNTIGQKLKKGVHAVGFLFLFLARG